MANVTKIQWADLTLNPWIGCTKVSRGCLKCYAEHATPTRAMGIGWGKGAPRHRTKTFDLQAIAADRRAKRLGRSLKVFPSLCDWLDAEVPVEWLAAFLEIVGRTPHLTWILLTKRPELWRIRLEQVRNPKICCVGSHCWLITNRWLFGEAPANVWFVFSAEDQETYDKRAAAALQVPAVVHGASLEPLLEPIKLNQAVDGPQTFPLGRQLRWIITGGESAMPGDTPRPCDVFWIEEIVRQCRQFECPVFVKQLGGHCVTSNANAHDWPEHVTFTESPIAPSGFAAGRVGLNDPKGGDPAEWPEELRVRQWPEVGP